jgi:hypothetical protein
MSRRSWQDSLFGRKLKKKNHKKKKKFLTCGFLMNTDDSVQKILLVGDSGVGYVV